MKNNKNGIFYFSGTGNSLYLAKQLASKMKDVQLYSIPKELNDGKLHYDLKVVGFVIPTYYLGLPKIVHRFIDNLDLKGVEYVFVIATKGWGISGGALAQLHKKTKKKGIPLHYGHSIVMPFNDFNFGKVDSQHIQNKKHLNSEAKIDRIINDITHRKTGITFEPFSLLTPLRNPSFINNVSHMDEAFGVDDFCSSCGICAKVCPVNNINMATNTPTWEHKCEFCLACYNYCPTGQITFKSQKRSSSTHYKHPKITPKEMYSEL